MVALPQVGKVIVDGANLSKRHTPSNAAPPCRAGSSTRTCPSRIGRRHRLPGDGPTRIGMRIDETGRKIRICRKCETEL